MNANRWVWLVLLCVSPVFSVSAQSRQPVVKLRGMAYDSVRARPLALATIQLVNARNPSDTRAIRADSLGRFSVDSLQPGSWIVGALHPWLDSLAVDELTVRVEVKAKGTSRTGYGAYSVGRVRVEGRAGRAVAARCRSAIGTKGSLSGVWSSVARR